MKKAALALICVSLLAAVLLTVARVHPGVQKNGPLPTLPNEVKISQSTPTKPPPSVTNTLRRWPSPKHKASEFTADEKAMFAATFQAKYRPAIFKWCDAFKGHIPINPTNVSPADLVDRIGNTSAYSEYVFVVDGITLGVQDKNGTARVDYLNAPKQTSKLAILPDGSAAPVLSTPVTRQQVTQMLQADCGVRFAPQNIRIEPSGLSGSLNGGMLVDVGGDPENGASWDYDMVFDSAGKLAYFLRGYRCP